MRPIGVSKILALAIALWCAGSATAQQLPAELDMLPRDEAGVVSIRVQDLMTNAALKPLRDVLLKDERSVQELEMVLGNSLADIERVSILLPDADVTRLERFDPPTVVLVVTTVKPYDRKKVLERMNPNPNDDGFGFGRKKEIKDGYKDGFKDDFKKDGFKDEFKKTEDFREKRPFADKKPEFKDEKRFPDGKRSDDRKPATRQVAVKPAQLVSFQPEKKERFDLKRDSHATQLGFTVTFVNERTLLVTPNNRGPESSGLGSLVGSLMRRAAKGPLADALAQAAKAPIVAGFTPNAVKIVFRDLGDAGPQPLFLAKDGLAILKIDESAKASVRLRFASADDAIDGEKILKMLLAAGAREFAKLKMDVDQFSPNPVSPILLGFAIDLLKAAKVERQEESVTVATQMPVAELAKPFSGAFALKLNAARDRTISINNLKQIALASYGYHDTYKTFPFFRAAKMHPGLSWRVAILPFLEETPLFNQFKLDEPWDSPNNIKLVDKMPKVYAPLGGMKAKPGHTFYQSFSGPGTIGSAQKIFSITDGTSNTLMVVEAGEAVIWSKPGDLAYDANAPLPKLGGLFPGIANVAMCDGSVFTLPLPKLDEKTLRAIITVNGGEMFELPR
jgi:hypothetical protein